MFLVNIDIEICTCCGDCVVVCPTYAFQNCPDGKVDPYYSGECTGCISCIEACPEKCIEIIEI